MEAPEHTHVEWKRIQQNLHRLKCPFVSYLTSPEVLLEAGEIRNTILSWLFSLYDGEWMKKIETKELSELSALTQMASSMGLCSPNDLALVKGGGSQYKQIAFWQTLIDLVMLHAEFSENLDSQIFTQLDFMDNISRASKVIFREQPFKSTFPIPFTAKTDVPNLEEKVAHITSQVNELKTQLAQLPPYDENDFNYTEEFTNDVARNLHTARELLRIFSEVSEKDFEPWIQSHPTKPAQYVGDMPAVIKSCLAVIQLLESYKTVNTRNAQLREYIKSNNGSDEAGDEKLEVSTSTMNSRVIALNMYNSNKKRR